MSGKQRVSSSATSGKAGRVSTVFSRAVVRHDGMRCHACVHTVAPIAQSLRQMNIARNCSPRGRCHVSRCQIFVAAVLFHSSVGHCMPPAVCARCVGRCNVTFCLCVFCGAMTHAIGRGMTYAEMMGCCKQDDRAGFGSRLHIGRR